MFGGRQARFGTMNAVPRLFTAWFRHHKLGAVLRGVLLPGAWNGPNVLVRHCDEGLQEIRDTLSIYVYTFKKQKIVE